MTTYNNDLSIYNASLFAPHDEALRRAWEDSPKRGLPPISIRPEEGKFLQILTRSCGARKALEIGTLGGYSAIWIARGLLPGGKLVTLEKDAFHAEVARQHLDAAGLSNVVEIRTGEALQLLPQLAADGPFDFIFIDADKAAYADYFDWSLENTRLGGMICAHNAFRGGSIVHTNPDETARMMQAFNRRVAGEPRLLSTIYPAGDGTLVSVKIS